jgi:hypothetical protein
MREVALDAAGGLLVLALVFLSTHHDLLEG